MHSWGQQVGSVNEDATKTNDMNSVSGLHMVEGENWLLQIIFWPSYMSHMTCAHPPHHHTQ